MSTFTPEQIQEILDLYFENFAHRQYIGARYVPIFGRKDETSIEWDNTGTYEPLTIVLYQGNSYTSRQFVPVGVEITNEIYWANTGNYNAQVEQYRQEVLSFSDRINDKIIGFANVNEMINSTRLYNNAICHTNSFNENSDFGGAYYHITNSGNANGKDVIKCGDYYANLIYDEIINIDCLGAIGDGLHDDYDFIERAFELVNDVEISNRKYFVGQTIKLGYKSRLSGKNKHESILYFNGSNGVQLNHSIVLENLTIDFTGNYAGIYLYTPDDYAYQLSSVVQNICMIHSTDNNVGAFIKLEAENVSDAPYGAYDLLFSEMECRQGCKYGIQFNNKVKTTVQDEAWLTDIKFVSMFFAKVETCFYSDWTDISGNNSVPHTGAASVNGSIKFNMVSAQYVEGFTENFAIMRNVHGVEFIDCTPFDYYRLPNVENKPIFIINGNYTNSMSLATFYFMNEFPKYSNALKKYISFENSNDYNTTFNKCVKFLGVGTDNDIYGNFHGFNLVEKNDFRLKASNQIYEVNSDYGTLVEGGGVFIIGQLVVINFAININADTTLPANTNLLTSTLPQPFGARALFPVSCDKVNAYIRYNGELRLSEAYADGGTIVFAACYLSEYNDNFHFPPTIS